MIRLERYIEAPDKTLRLGYTTGTCAAASAAAATTLLLQGKAPAAVIVDTPYGIEVAVEVEEAHLGYDDAVAATRKDAGDDPDVTDGILVYARVCKAEGTSITIDGGVGVGRVTLGGLDQPPGSAAINSGPRTQIERAVREVAKTVGYNGGLAIEIFVPEGERIAEHTLNSRLGIEGGISILGTTGIVRPMSEEALIETIKVELRVQYAQGYRDLILVPGNYGERYVHEVMGLQDVALVTCSNYIGAAVDEACRLGFSSLLLVGHAGKLVKVAAGIFNTHSAVADGRFEVLATHAALSGATPDQLEAMRHEATVDGMLNVLSTAGFVEKTMMRIADRIEERLRQRAKDTLEVGCILFSNDYGELSRSAAATDLECRLKGVRS